MRDEIKNALQWLGVAALFIALQFAPLPIRDLAARTVFAAFALVCLWIAAIQIGIARKWIVGRRA